MFQNPPLILSLAVSVLALQTLMAETPQEVALLNAAKTYFSDDVTPVTPSEEFLFRKTANGVVADFRKGTTEESINNWSKWGDDRKIRAERLAWLLSHTGATGSDIASQGIVIVGALIHGKLELRSKAALPFVAESCIFDSDIDLRETKIGFVDLSRSHIHALDAGNAQIDHDLSLEGVAAQDSVSLYAALIGGSLVCTSGFFKGAPFSLDFSRAKITGEVILDKANFQDTVRGAEATVESIISDTTIFQERLELTAAKIGHGVYLIDSHATTGISLRGGTVGPGDLWIQDGSYLQIDLSDMVLGGRLCLLGVRVDGIVDLQNSQVTRAFILSGMRINDKSEINLQFARVGTLSNSKDSWPKKGNLTLLGFVYDQIDPGARPEAGIQLQWIHRQRGGFLAQPYDQLAAALRRMGLNEEADEVMIAKGRDDGRHRKEPMAAVWYKGLGKLIGFGYRPWNALFVSIGIIFVGMVLFGIGFRKTIVTPTSEVAYGTVRGSTHQLLDSYPKFNSFIYSLETFIPIVKFEVAQYWIPNANKGSEIRIGKIVLFRTGGLLRAYLWIHISLGWILTTIWIAGFTGLLKV